MNKFTVLPVSLDESVFGVKLLFTFYGALDFMKKANLMIAGSLGFLVLSLGLGGCGNPKEANKGNFAKAIAQKLGEKPAYTIPDGSNELSRISACTIGMRNIGIGGIFTSEWNDQLTKLGFLSRRTVTKPPNQYSGPREEFIYELTEQGKQLAKPVKDEPGNADYYIPFCKVSFKEVLSYTEPSDAMGVKVSQVKYAYTLEDFPDWVKNEALLSSSDWIRQVVNSAGKPLTANESVMLTNEGWATDLPK